MAVQQRIIGGGLLIAGIAVVLILIFNRIDRDLPFDEAYKQLRDLYPRYMKADEDGDYEALRRLAREAIEIENATTMPSVLQEIKSDAAANKPDAAALLKLLERVPDGQGGTRDTFENNVAGLYAFDGRWYDSATHAVLWRMRRSLDEAIPALTAAHKAATAIATELENLRVGSGAELALPAADPSIKTPVVAAEAAVLRVFGLPAAEVTKALGTKGNTAKANSARLVWNREDAAGVRARLAQDVAKVPAYAETIERAAVTLAQVERDLKGRDAAQKQAADMLKQAVRQVGAVLDGPGRQAFEAETTIGSLADALKQDAKLLKGYAANAPGLGQALAGNFAP